MEASSPVAMCGFSPVFRHPGVHLWQALCVLANVQRSAVSSSQSCGSWEELGQAQQLLRCARRMVGPAASLQLHRMPVANAPVVATSSCAQACGGSDGKLEEKNETELIRDLLFLHL